MGTRYNCVALKQYGLKCSPVAPCHSCRRRQLPPQDSGLSDQEYRGISEEHGSRPDFHRNFLNDLFEVLRALEDTYAQKLLEMIRSDTSFEKLYQYLDQVLSDMIARNEDEASRSKLRTVRYRMEAYSRVPSFCPKITDPRYMGRSSPFQVPAKPWTTVTDDGDLVSYLVSLYFTWDYPFYAFIDRDVLIKHISRGEIHSDFCTPFLVNAILANACHYAQYADAFVLPGDVKSMGTDFLAEAEKKLYSHQFETGSDVRLASVQGMLLLSERYTMSGEDDYGYSMLHRAISMAEALGIVNGPQLGLGQSHMTDEMIVSIKRTAWGIFQVDTVVHANFLRPSRVSNVSVNRIDRNVTDETDLWHPYPFDKRPRPSWMSQYFDEACKLSMIARDVSRVSIESENDIQDRKEALYLKLVQWEEELPEYFAPIMKPPSHILILRMRYHALVINLVFDSFGGNLPFFTTQQPQRQSTPTPTEQETSTITKNANRLQKALASARAISALIRLHRSLYGIVRAHQYVTYAMMLALFAMLEQHTFDALDYDFISLTSSFSIAASCSQVGRNLFHIFRQSVRIRCQQQTPVSEEKKGLADGVVNPPDRWNGYAEGLQKLVDNDGIEDNEENHGASGIGEMLRMYENMSFGKEDGMLAREQSSSFRFSPSPE